MTLDKSEGVVKGIVLLAGAEHRWVLPGIVSEDETEMKETERNLGPNPTCNRF